MNQTQTLPPQIPQRCSSDTPTATLEPDPCPLQGKATARRRVLVVEDHPLLRFALIDALIGQGYECYGAEHGLAALGLLSTASVDLVVTDLSMPQMGGLELIRQMVSHPIFYSIPVIVVTGSLTEEARRRILSAGAKAALLRSSRHDHVFEAIRTVLLGSPRPRS